MKRVIVDTKNIGSEEFDRYLIKYAKKLGYKTPCFLLPTDVLCEVISLGLMSYAALDININETFELQLTESILLVCRKTSKYSLDIEAKSVQESLGIPDNDPMFNSLANPINHKVLDANEMFRHPLSEIHRAENPIESLINGYGVATMLINAIRFPEETQDNAKKATDIFCQLILQSDPTIQVMSMLERVKAGQLSYMLKASTHIHDAVMQSAEV